MGVWTHVPGPGYSTGAPVVKTDAAVPPSQSTVILGTLYALSHSLMLSFLLLL